MTMQTVTLNGSLTIERVAEIKALMQIALTDHTGTEAIEVDLATVGEFDAAGLQLLMAFALAAKSAGTYVKLCNTSDAIDAVLTLYGVRNRFAEEEAA
ncbi:STAS domain-containing protein [Herbaspirillum sp. RTI4]|uniref:STAS domain-containing protein n=1 Tax=Herbaspirillum sp. RTI4 TaxID=3048640 RepID=UPI002AB578E6|nr:STAS domain-containing protein [Herbaspirillum sp. RTI4]MDY7578085.1 STAS domain-containing protein [Herbaspirillum sp. RTI4]MEA9980675.1 STAS domain-containing protein [Herbaspirillum sp. RTI4]